MMSDEDNRSDEERQSGQPARSRFQQPGAKPPVTGGGSTRPSRADDSASARGKSSEETKARKSEATTPSVPVSTEEPVASTPEERPFPPDVTLYADHPLTLMDRLQSLYDQAGLNPPLPKRWSLGVTLAVADADQWDQIQAALQDNLPALLPIALRVTAVEPTVRDRQSYSVGWMIDPDSLDTVRQARASIVTALQPLVPDLSQTSLNSTIQVAEEVAALAFPTLIAAMQHEFVPFAWSIDSLVFMPPED
jgi:hypothetical protein